MKKSLILMLITMLLPLTAAAEEAYVEYNDETLTFYYDNYRESRSGYMYTVDIAGSNSDIPEWNIKTRERIEKVVFSSSFARVRPKNTSSWFYSFSNLQQIEGIVNLNTSEVTDMNYMFSGCQSLTTLDVSTFNTSNVTDMRSMFNSCGSLTALDLSSWNTSKVTNMRAMFSGCIN